MFAAVPLIFAAQQMAEGTVWLTMNGEYPAVHRLAVISFLAVAFVVWPTWLSFSLRLFERSVVRRRSCSSCRWSRARSSGGTP